MDGVPIRNRSRNEWSDILTAVAEKDSGRKESVLIEHAVSHGHEPGSGMRQSAHWQGYQDVIVLFRSLSWVRHDVLQRFGR